MRSIVALAFSVSLFFSAPLLLQAQEKEGVKVGTFETPSDARPLASPKDLPASVRNTLKDSVVGVFVYRSYTEKDPSHAHLAGTGMVIGANLVLTRYHVIAPPLSEDLFSDEPIKERAIDVVFRGVTYRASVRYWKVSTDLMLLTVHDKRKKAFQGKPLPLVDGVLGANEEAYTFNRAYPGQTYYGMHQGFAGYGKGLESPSGANALLFAKDAEGFSGSPVVDDFGKCRGSVWGMVLNEQETIFTPVGEMVKFLRQARVR